MVGSSLGVDESSFLEEDVDEFERVCLGDDDREFLLDIIPEDVTRYLASKNGSLFRRPAKCRIGN